MAAWSGVPSKGEEEDEVRAKGFAAVAEVSLHFRARVAVTES